MKIGLFLLMLSGMAAYASGTFVVPPPMPVETEIDCSEEKNKDKDECKNSEVKK